MDSPIRALLVEDNPRDAELFLGSLSEEGACELLWVSTLAAARVALDAEDPDIVVLDLELSDASDLVALSAIKAQVPHVPVVVLTGRADNDVALRALQHGAQDYLVKGQVERAHVLRALRYAIERQRFEQERELLLSAVGHDLRNPLGAVRMAANLVLIDDQGVPERVRSRVTRIANSADRMNRLIEQLLSFARVRSGAVNLDLDDVDLAALCTLVIDEVELAHPEARLRLTVAPGGAGGRFDHDRLVQVVQNLVTNAVIHGEHDVIDVRVRQSGRSAVVEVENAGAIADAELKTLFRPFRPSRGRSRSNGLGLGLSIAHQLVIAHGGTLTATSAGGRVVFTARLPAGDFSG